MSLSWTHPTSAALLRRVELRLVRGSKVVGTVAVKVRSKALRAGGVATLGKTRRVTVSAKRVSARFALSVAPKLAGQRLALEVAATGTNGRRQSFERAGTLRVLR